MSIKVKIFPYEIKMADLKIAQTRLHSLLIDFQPNIIHLKTKSFQF